MGMLQQTIQTTLTSRAESFSSLPDGNPVALKRASTVKSMVLSHESRPLDMISFLANDDYIVDDTKHTPRGQDTLKEIEEDEEEFSVTLPDSKSDPDFAETDIIAPEAFSPGATQSHQQNVPMAGSLTMELATQIEMQQRKGTMPFGENQEGHLDRIQE